MNKIKNYSSLIKPTTNIYIDVPEIVIVKYSEDIAVAELKYGVYDFRPKNGNYSWRENTERGFYGDLSYNVYIKFLSSADPRKSYNDYVQDKIGTTQELIQSVSYNKLPDELLTLNTDVNDFYDSELVYSNGISDVSFFSSIASYRIDDYKSLQNLSFFCSIVPVNNPFFNDNKPIESYILFGGILKDGKRNPVIYGQPLINDEVVFYTPSELALNTNFKGNTADVDYYLGITPSQIITKKNITSNAQFQPTPPIQNYLSKKKKKYFSNFYHTIIADTSAERNDSIKLIYSFEYENFIKDNSKILKSINEKFESTVDYSKLIGYTKITNATTTIEKIDVNNNIKNIDEKQFDYLSVVETEKFFNYSINSQKIFSGYVDNNFKKDNFPCNYKVKIKVFDYYVELINFLIESCKNIKNSLLKCVNINVATSEIRISSEKMLEKGASMDEIMGRYGFIINNFGQDYDKIKQAILENAYVLYVSKGFLEDVIAYENFYFELREIFNSQRDIDNNENLLSLIGDIDVIISKFTKLTDSKIKNYESEFLYDTLLDPKDYENKLLTKMFMFESTTLDEILIPSPYDAPIQFLTPFEIVSFSDFINNLDPTKFPEVSDAFKKTIFNIISKKFFEQNNKYIDEHVLFFDLLYKHIDELVNPFTNDYKFKLNLKDSITINFPDQIRKKFSTFNLKYTQIVDMQEESKRILSQLTNETYSQVDLFTELEVNFPEYVTKFYNNLTSDSEYRVLYVYGLIYWLLVYGNLFRIEVLDKFDETGQGLWKTFNLVSKPRNSYIMVRLTKVHSDELGFPYDPFFDFPLNESYQIIRV